MLSDTAQLDVLRKLLDYVLPDGSILISDERKNIKAFEAVFREDDAAWSVTLAKRGFLFMRRGEDSV